VGGFEIGVRRGVGQSDKTIASSLYFSKGATDAGAHERETLIARGEIKRIVQVSAMCRLFRPACLLRAAVAERSGVVRFVTISANVFG